MSQRTQSKSKKDTSSRKIMPIELTLGHTSWYWAHHQGEPSKVQFSVHNGLLLLGKKKIPVGIDISDKRAQVWLSTSDPDKCKYIRTVKVSNSMDLEFLDQMPHLQALECNDIYSERLQDVVGNFNNLRILHLASCDGMENLKGFAKNAKALLKLTITDSDDLNGLDGIENLVELKDFNLIHCDNIWEIAPLSFVISLEKLVIRNCENIHKLNPIGVLTNLMRLEISRCKQVKDISAFQNLEGVKYLDLSDCQRLIDISTIANLKGIEQLHLFGCRHIRNLRPIYNMKNMKKISLPSSVNEQNLSIFCITYKENLEELDLRSCIALKDISPISELENLKVLKLSGCTQIESVKPLRKLKNLAKLDIADCKKIQNIEPLLELPELKNLYVGGCSNLKREEVVEFDRAKPECKVHYV